MMQDYFEPIECCSTAFGRALVSWYCSLEGYICFLFHLREILPIQFRQENVRQRLPYEYGYLSERDRKPRLLDDTWAEILAVVPIVTEVAAGLPQLYLLNENDRARSAHYFIGRLTKFYQQIEKILRYDSVKEAFELVPQDLVLPLTPRSFRFPLAGSLYAILRSIMAYVYYILFRFLYRAVNADPRAIENARNFSAYCVVEMCRSFEGVEISFKDDRDIMYPFFFRLITTSTIFPPFLQNWIDRKLSQGNSKRLLLHFKPIKHILGRLLINCQKPF